MLDQLLKPFAIEYADVFLLYGNQPFFLEVGKGARDGFQFQPQVGTDFLAGHAQVELCRRETAGGEALRQVEQEGCQPFLGPH